MYFKNKITDAKTTKENLVGTWSELYELMELADRGKVKLSMQEYKLDDANKALHDLNDGKVKGRAVLVCLLYTSPSPRDYAASRMPSSA